MKSNNEFVEITSKIMKFIPDNQNYIRGNEITSV